LPYHSQLDLTSLSRDLELKGHEKQERRAGLAISRQRRESLKARHQAAALGASASAQKKGEVSLSLA